MVDFMGFVVHRSVLDRVWEYASGETKVHIGVGSIFGLNMGVFDGAM